MIPVNPIHAGVVAALIGCLTFSYMKGRSDGYASSEAKHAQIRDKLNNKISELNEDVLKKTEDLLEFERSNEELLKRIGNNARKDPNANTRGIGANSVRRLNSVQLPELQTSP